MSDSIPDKRSRMKQDEDDEDNLDLEGQQTRVGLSTVRSITSVETSDCHLESIINNETIGDAESSVINALSNMPEVQRSSTTFLKTLDTLDEDSGRDVATQSIMARVPEYVLALAFLHKKKEIHEAILVQTRYRILYVEMQIYNLIIAKCIPNA
ncbi:hypothetical protein QCA50_007893 [Cerrena zonata]|uniref:Uncharacterized protein n=1 Tax=Cerrena zonata TaxID=2478898 RepID=A0AAW0GGY4_9APHY